MGKIEGKGKGKILGQNTREMGARAKTTEFEGQGQKENDNVTRKNLRPGQNDVKISEKIDATSSKVNHQLTKNPYRFCNWGTSLLLLLFFFQTK